MATLGEIRRKVRRAYDRQLNTISQREAQAEETKQQLIERQREIDEAQNSLTRSRQFQGIQGKQQRNEILNNLSAQEQFISENLSSIEKFKNTVKSLKVNLEKEKQKAIKKVADQPAYYSAPGQAFFTTSTGETVAYTSESGKIQTGSGVILDERGIPVQSTQLLETSGVTMPTASEVQLNQSLPAELRNLSVAQIQAIQEQEQFREQQLQQTGEQFQSFEQGLPNSIALPQERRLGFFEGLPDRVAFERAQGQEPSVTDKIGLTAVGFGTAAKQTAIAAASLAALPITTPFGIFSGKGAENVQGFFQAAFGKRTLGEGGFPGVSQFLKTEPEQATGQILFDVVATPSFFIQTAAKARRFAIPLSSKRGSTLVSEFAGQEVMDEFGNVIGFRKKRKANMGQLGESITDENPLGLAGGDPIDILSRKTRSEQIETISNLQENRIISRAEKERLVKLLKDSGLSESQIKDRIIGSQIELRKRDLDNLLKQGLISKSEYQAELKRLEKLSLQQLEKLKAEFEPIKPIQDFGMFEEIEEVIKEPSRPTIVGGQGDTGFFAGTGNYERTGDVFRTKFKQQGGLLFGQGEGVLSPPRNRQLFGQGNIFLPISVTKTKQKELEIQEPLIKNLTLESSIFASVNLSKQSQPMFQPQKESQATITPSGSASSFKFGIPNTLGSGGGSSRKGGTPKKPAKPVPVNLPDAEQDILNTVRKLARESKAFDVFVKTEGRFRKVADDLPLNRALKKGSDIVDNTLAARFKIVPDKKAKPKMKDIKFKVNPGVFRNFTISKGKKRALPFGEFIELRSQRLNTTGERNEIQMNNRKKNPPQIKFKKGFKLM